MLFDQWHGVIMVQKKNTFESITTSHRLTVLLCPFSSQGFLHFSRPMESVESTRQWRARLPEFECCGRGKTEQAHDRDGPRVCQTPASRWRPTERQYTARRPLFTSEQCASSSKKTQPLTHTEKVSGDWRGITLLMSK